MLTGRRAEEMPGSMGDLLPELLQLHERVRQVMRGIAQALWPSISLPEGLGELCRKAEGSMAALPAMEDISLLSGCQGSLGNGEDTVHEG